MAQLTVEDMATYCRKKGFVYKNSDIYGGLSGFFDYGHLGSEFKNNIKAAFWKRFVQDRDDVVGIDGSIISHAKVWEASGHVGGFTDAVIKCAKCGNQLRADQFLEEKLKQTLIGVTPEQIDKLVAQHKIACPKCGGPFDSAKKFNLMFETNIGPVKTSESTAYLRPETAQLIFTNFRLVQEHARMKLPFGIAQLGKAFRNEISPRDFLFRCREFEQFEIEFFVHPNKLNECPSYDSIKDVQVNIGSGETTKKNTMSELMKEGMIKSQWHAYWLVQYYQFFIDHGVREENLRLRAHEKEELAHYANSCFDIEYKFPSGWKEIHGNADRGDFDLQQHIKVSKTDLSYFDQDSKERVVPCVIEPSQGIDRAFLTFMFDAHFDDTERGNVVLKLHPSLSPIKVGVFPLVNKLDLEARKVFDSIRKDFVCQFDRSGSIGRRYARADEIGIPYCVTVDFGTLEDKAVTIRDRDSTHQIRVPLATLTETLGKLLRHTIPFDKAGTPIAAQQKNE